MTSSTSAEDVGSPPSEAIATGGPLLTVDLAATVAFVVATVVAAAWPGNVTDVANIAVSAVLFLGGCAAFAVGFLRAAGRSRHEVVDLAGLFYLTGSAPRTVRRRFLGLWFAQIAVAAASVAYIRPPFGVMAPVWGIGVITLWSSRHGTFPARPRGGRT